jgi:hypothetical protein
MNNQLKDLLLTYLGELMNNEEQEPDMFKKDFILQRIEAIHILLDLPFDRKYYINRLIECVKNIQP